MTEKDLFFFSSRSRHTRCGRDWSSDVCSSDLHRFAYHISAPREDGKSVSNAIRYALKEAKIKPQQLQIGRASCRERVQISAAAVPLQKKKLPSAPLPDHVNGARQQRHQHALRL